MGAERYTLVIPTYNRPDDLDRLLRFLVWQKAPFKILVLDSSQPEIKERNANHARQHPLDLRIEQYDTRMPPWEKFWRGTQKVQTEFASLCADDDLLLVSSIAPLVNHLETHPQFSIAHGWYFNFYLTNALGLTRVVYNSPSIDDDDPIERLHMLLCRYEALTYAVHRTGVLQKLFESVQSLHSMLGRELLGGAISVVHGKAARLPLLYVGRSLAPSGAYQDWHPAEFLLSSPQSLFDEYARYRVLLLASLAEQGYPADESAKQRVDLVHLRYLSEYFTPEAIDYIIGHVRAQTPRPEVVSGLWPVLSRKSGVEGFLENISVLRAVRDRYFPWLRGYHVRKAMGQPIYDSVAATTASGRRRPYEVYEAFRSELSKAPQASLADLLAVLAGYE